MTSKIGKKRTVACLRGVSSKLLSSWHDIALNCRWGCHAPTGCELISRPRLPGPGLVSYTLSDPDLVDAVLANLVLTPIILG